MRPTGLAVLFAGCVLVTLPSVAANPPIPQAYELRYPGGTAKVLSSDHLQKLAFECVTKSPERQRICVFLVIEAARQTGKAEGIAQYRSASLHPEWKDADGIASVLNHAWIADNQLQVLKDDFEVE